MYLEVPHKKPKNLYQPGQQIGPYKLIEPLGNKNLGQPLYWLCEKDGKQVKVSTYTLYGTRRK